VSHHPPISACYANSPDFEYMADSDVNMSFKGNSMIARVPHSQHIKLTRTEEHFTFVRPDSHVNNILFGTLYIEHVGEGLVKNKKTGEVCVMDFKPEGSYGRSKHEIEAYVYRNEEEAKQKKNDKLKLLKIAGTWTGELKSWQMRDGKVVWNTEQLLWQCSSPQPANFEMNYRFVDFALQLNYIPDSLREKLPPTDSRFRPD